MASSLKKISQQPRTLNDLKKVLEEIKNDGPRGACILASSLPEGALEQLLLSKMQTLTSTERDQLFGPTAPLGTFSAQIRLAYAMGYISKKARHDLDLIRDIRNAFAHAANVINFDTKEIAEACSGFHCTKTPRSTENIRTRYVMAARILAVYLMNKTKSGSVPVDRMPELLDLE